MTKSIKSTVKELKDDILDILESAAHPKNNTKTSANSSKNSKTENGSSHIRQSSHSRTLSSPLSEMSEPFDRNHSHSDTDLLAGFGGSGCRGSESSFGGAGGSGTCDGDDNHGGNGWGNTFLYSPVAALPLAERLTSQRWHEIGNAPAPMIGASDDFDVMVDQLASILGARLRELLLHRMMASTWSINVKSSLGSSLTSKDGLSNSGTSNAETARNALDFLKLDMHLGDYVLSDSIASALRLYVSKIGHLHNGVGFHSFQHATHVTISMNKLLSMVTTVDDLNGGKNAAKRRISSQDIAYSRRGSADSTTSDPGSYYDRQRAERLSFGISEDPRIRFAMIFSALIHDVGHTGVPNSVLVEEEDELAILHNDVSVAEQNSLQIAFSLMQHEDFQELKRCIGPTPEERKFFRKKVIGMVMVTDISDQERLQIVASRWKEAFPPEYEGIQDATTELPPPSQELKQAVDRRRFSMFSTGQAAEEFVSERKFRRLGIRHSMDLSGMLLDAYPLAHTLQQHAVLDAMMNVADVAHTMQSFTVFVKWNRRLFKELFAAHLKDRLKFDPSDNWYENQIGFFSHYIIPLSQKMKTCGVFGATGTVFEYFALENRKRWMLEGEEISEIIVREVKQELEKEGLERGESDISSELDKLGVEDGVIKFQDNGGDCKGIERNEDEEQQDPEENSKFKVKDVKF